MTFVKDAISISMPFFCLFPHGVYKRRHRSSLSSEIRAKETKAWSTSAWRRQRRSESERWWTKEKKPKHIRMCVYCIHYNTIKERDGRRKAGSFFQIARRSHSFIRTSPFPSSSSLSVHQQSDTAFDGRPVVDTRMTYISSIRRTM